MLYISFTDAREGGQGDFKKEVDKWDVHGNTKKALARLFVGLSFFGGILIAVALDRFCPDENCKDDCKSAPKGEPEAENVEMGECAGAAEARSKQQRTDALIGLETSTNDTDAMDKQTGSGPSLSRVSLVTFLAMTVHNFPEGIAVFCDMTSGTKLLTVAIALHNIPEGAAVAIPVYQTSKSLLRAVVMTFISGLTQPIGALFA